MQNTALSLCKQKKILVGARQVKPVLMYTHISEATLQPKQIWTSVNTFCSLLTSRLILPFYNKNSVLLWFHLASVPLPEDDSYSKNIYHTYPFFHQPLLPLLRMVNGIFQMNNGCSNKNCRKFLPRNCHQNTVWDKWPVSLDDIFSTRYFGKKILVKSKIKSK